MIYAIAIDSAAFSRAYFALDDKVKIQNHVQEPAVTFIHDALPFVFFVRQLLAN